jgi:hypothetical protein
VSYGDVSSWQFSYIPNAKMFGRSPAAVYSGMGNGTQPSRPGYSFQCPNLTLVDHYQPNLPRWGQEYPNLEEVWLTPEGVANGEDDVVNRALEWMNNLVFPHNIVTDSTYYSQDEDSVHIFTTIENPNSNLISATAYLKTIAGILIDSISLSPLLTNLNGEQWYGNLELPSTEDFYTISVTAFDITNSGSFSLPNATRFTTAGPVVIDSIYVFEGSNNFAVRPYLKNQSIITTITKAAVKVICNDPWIVSITPSIRDLPDILPDSTVSSPNMFFVIVDTSIFPGYFNFEVEVISEGWVYWKDTLRVPQVVLVDDEIPVPLSFKLEQNYPNPFNPSTKISWQLPKAANVTIKIFNALGEEVATLVDNEYQNVGTHSSLFIINSSLTSGVYFYQLKAGEYVNTKKMILLK